ncbi:MAG: DMT family transporter [Hyphomicrobium sp.]|nr:DMT family transporter [Hyphomicrobium sp.]
MSHALPPNVVSILAMTGAVAAFSLSDVWVKLVSSHMPLGQLIVIRNTMATLMVLSACVWLGHLRLPPEAPKSLLAWRMFGEAGSTLAFLGGLVSLSIADATAIAQITPIAVTAAGAIFLGEHVGWRRWLAAAVALVGVLIIVRPGTGAFSLAGLLVIVSVAFIVLRDITTRGIRETVPTLMLTLMSAASAGAAGLLLAPFETWITPSVTDIAILAAGAASLTCAYALITVAMRTGEIAAAMPFRYTGIVFALAAGWLIWGDWPDPLSLLGIAIVVAAGVYTLHREHKLQRDAKIAAVNR